MTEDRDFKKVVRKRSAKTGESYQTARRQVERHPVRLSARVGALWAHPAGLVLGCIVEEGRIIRGMSVTVMAGDNVVHKGTVASLRRGKVDVDVVASGECGIMLEPAFYGYVAVEGDQPGVEVIGALKPVVIGPTPDRVIAI
jgi:translation initiation factor IF-2